jgi:hypothetical protein
MFAFDAWRAVHCRVGCAHPQTRLLLMKLSGSAGSELTSQYCAQSKTERGNQCLKPIKKANATL